MLGDIRQARNIYIVCGYTDMRKGLNSLVPFIQQSFKIDPYSSSLFLFCGKRCDRLKALLRSVPGVRKHWRDFHREGDFRGIFCRKRRGFSPGISPSEKAVFAGVQALFPV